MFRIGGILFNENLGYDSNWNMKTSLTLQTATSNLVIEITYLSGGLYVIFGFFVVVSFVLFSALGSLSFGHFTQSLLYLVFPLCRFLNLSHISVFGLNSYHVGVRCV
jgi:hypothetical protein